MFETLKAPNGALDSTLADAKGVVSALAAKGITAVIFCNEVGQLSDRMMPATKSQDNGDAPDVDDTETLEDIQLPDSEPVYLCLWVQQLFQQSGSTSYYDVGMMLFVNKNYGVPLEKLLA